MEKSIDSIDSKYIDRYLFQRAQQDEWTVKSIRAGFELRTRGTVLIRVTQFDVLLILPIILTLVISVRPTREKEGGVLLLGFRSIY